MDIPALAQEAQEILATMLPLLLFEAKLTTTTSPEGVRIHVECEDASRLIGRGGSTIREVQHNFSSLLRLVQRGEEIEVFSRKKLVARIVPPQAVQSPFQPVDWSDLPARLQTIWKGEMVHGSSTGRVLDELRGER